MNFRLSPRQQEALAAWLLAALPLVMLCHVLFVVGWRFTQGCWLYRAWVLGRYEEACGGGDALLWELGLMAAAEIVALPVAAWLTGRR